MMVRYSLEYKYTSPKVHSLVFCPCYSYWRLQTIVVPPFWGPGSPRRALGLLDCEGEGTTIQQNAGDYVPAKAA